MERALITPPRVLDDPAWERAVLGPFVERARRRLFSRAPNDPRAALLRAYRAVPFYQERFRRAALGLADLRDPRAWSSVPITRRADLAIGVAPFLAHPLWPDALPRGWLGHTSGSTGEPVAYLRDPRTHAWFWAFLDYALAYVGRRATSAPPGLMRVMLLDALAHLPEYTARLPLFHDAQFVKHSAQRPIECDPQIVTGDPESLAALVHSDVRPSLVLSSAFALPATLKQAIEERTGAAVLEYYATQETSVIALGCRDGHGFHPLSGACHVEVVDGELLVTPLHNPSFILIRYAPGDLGTFADDVCSCGLRGRITELAGRAHVRFHGANGDFAAATVGPLLARLPVVEYQLVQRGVDRYLLRYRGSPLDASLDPLRTRLTELAGARITLELAHVSSIPRRTAKPQPFVVERA